MNEDYSFREPLQAPRGSQPEHRKRIRDIEFKIIRRIREIEEESAIKIQRWWKLFQRRRSLLENKQI